jgi:transcriptional regulator with XRE-family HTH domain
MRLISKERLKRQMQLKGYSLGALAEDVKVSKGFISHLTAGRKTTCTPRVAEEIARRLEVDLEILFVPSVSIDSGRVDQRQKAAA